MGLAGWIIAILALLLAVCAGALIVYKRNLLKVRRSLENLRRTQSNGRLRLSVPDRDLERLLEEVNALLDERQASDALHRRQERQRRQEIANISHDLRTPLTSILGYLQMIKSESTTPEERAEYLAIVESRAHALKALVTGFYDLSCLEAGGYALAQESVALAPLLVELAAAFYADFNADGREGFVLVNAMNITASVFINDDESGLHRDFEAWLENLAPEKPYSRYAHNGYEDNADAHLKRTVMGREAVVAITEGRLDFGTWEQIFYYEFDGGRDKHALVKIIGE